jgi:hypothetical protein
MATARNGRNGRKAFKPRDVNASVKEKKEKDGVLRVDEEGNVLSYRPIIREFENPETGEKYMYCYDKTDLPAIQNAETVFRYREDQVENPPINLRLLEESLGGHYMIEAFQHLLIRVCADGTLEPYDEIRARTKTREFITSTLKGKDWNALRECRRDFFIMAELQDNESKWRLLRSKKSGLELVEIHLRSIAIVSGIQKLRNELADFTNPENLSAEFENLKKTDLHGFSQDMTP